MNSLNTDPDNPQHKYDYRGYYKKYGGFPAEKGQHLTAEFKASDHPTRFIKGLDTAKEHSDAEILAAYGGDRAAAEAEGWMLSKKRTVRTEELFAVDPVLGRELKKPQKAAERLRPVLQGVKKKEHLYGEPTADFQAGADAEARRKKIKENLKSARLQRTREKLTAAANRRAWLAAAAESADDPALFEGIVEAAEAERRMYTPQAKRREGFVKQVNLWESSGAKGKGVTFEDWQKQRQAGQAEAMVPERAKFETTDFTPILQGGGILREMLLDEAYEDRKQPNGPTVRAANSLYLAEATGMEIKEASAVYDSLVRRFWGDKEPADVRPLSKLVRRWYANKAMEEQGIDPEIFRAAKDYAAGVEEIDWDTVLKNIPPDKSALFNSYVQQLTEPKKRGFFGKAAAALGRGISQAASDKAAQTVYLHPESSNVTVQVKNEMMQKFRDDNGGREPFGIEVYTINEQAKQQAIRRIMSGRKAKQAKEAGDPVKGENIASRAAIATLGILPDWSASLAEGVVMPVVGTFKYWREKTAVGIYEDMIDMGFEDDAARTTAQLTSIPVAAVNALQVSQLAGIAKGTQAKAAQAAGVSLTRYIAKRTGQYGVDVLKEYGEEWIESGFEVAGKAMAAVLAEEKPEIDWYNDVIAPELEGLKEAAWGFPLLVAGSHGVNVTKEAQYIRKMKRGGIPASIARGIVLRPEAFQKAIEEYKPVEVEGLAEAEAANKAAAEAEKQPGTEEAAEAAAQPQAAEGIEPSAQAETTQPEARQGAETLPVSGVERSALIGETVQRWNAAVQQYGEGSELAEYLSRRIGLLKRGASAEEVANLAMSYGIDESDVAGEGAEDTPSRLAPDSPLAGGEQIVSAESGKRADQARIDEVVGIANDILTKNGVSAEVRAVDKTVLSDETLEATGTRPTGATIFEGDGKAVIELAFAVNEAGQTADIETAAHEAWHVLRRVLGSDAIAVLDAAFGGDQEAEARAFGQFYRARMENRAVDMGAVEKVLQRILDMLRKIAGDFGKAGYRNAEALFEAAAEGKLKKGVESRETAGTLYEMKEDKAARKIAPQETAGGKGEVLSDDSGKPITVYHGTSANFDKFLQEYGDIGFHFGTTPNQAYFRLEQNREKGQIKEFYLSIKKPLRLKDVGNWYNPENIIKELSAKKIISQKESTQIINEYNRKFELIKKQGIETPGEIYGLSTFGKGRDIENPFNKLNISTLKKIQTILRERGYDGIVYKNEAETEWGEDSWIAFDNSQIIPKQSSFNPPAGQETPGKDIMFELKDGGKTREDEKYQADAEEAVAGAMAGSDPVRVKAFLDDLDKQAEALSVPEFTEDVREATKAAWAVFSDNNATTNDLSLAAVVEAAGLLGKYRAYEQSARPSKNWWQRRIEGLQAIWRESGREIAKDLVPMTTRLFKISPTVHRKVRAYQMDVFMRTAAMQKQVAPFLEGLYRLRKTNIVEYRQLWRAMLNGETAIRDRLIGKHGLTEHFQPVQGVFDTLFKTANKVGMEISYRKDYWPRLIVKMDAFLEYMYGQNADMRSFIEDALKKTVAARGGRELTDEERWRYVNSLLRGFRVGGLTLSRSGHALERRVEFVDDITQDFYGGLEESLMDYIVEMNTKITQREFFARETVEMVNLRAEKGRLLTRMNKLSGKEAGKVWTVREGWRHLEGDAFQEHISTLTKQLEAVNAKIKELDTGVLEQSVGRYVADAVANFRANRGEQITPRQESEMRNILTAVMDPRGYHGKLMKLFVGATYGTTLGSPTNSMTQLKEMALAYYRSGRYALPESIKALLGKSEIRPEDIGIENVGDEFSADNMNRLIRKILKATGFTLADRLGKTTYINTVLRKYRAQAGRLSDADAAAMAEGTKPKSEFYERVEKVFGDETLRVIAAIRGGAMDWDVKLLLFNELSDIQPVSVAEMPERYARGGNLRVFYMLKSFTVRQVDFARREILDDMRHPIKDPKRALRGLRRAAKLAFMLEAFGASSDLIKAILTGREFEPEDALINNLLQYAFMSRYTLSRMDREGWAQGWMQGWIPPMKTINDLTDAGEGDWVRSVPIGGELYYWWFGEGANK
jgi:Arc/MetJ family transcription regulator